MGNVALCEVLWHRGENGPALEYCRRAVEIEPRLRAGPLHLAWVYTSTGRYEEAITLLKNLPAEGIGPATTAGDLGYAYAKAGRVEDARAQLRNLQNAPPGDAGRHYDIALIHTALGDEAQALRHLEAEDARTPHLLNSLRYDPRLAPLRSEPRFSSLVRKLSSGGR
ncbi:MAG TPA: tetratricopeptide repeat protein, partial [Pyrinomonadaceae bacterium]|nr:tetratricopeptide repeat protein [Pyrinomonadaceae bacterium]